jgi:hypothetical protein
MTQDEYFEWRTKADRGLELYDGLTKEESPSDNPANKWVEEPGG